ncbi:hypothetical protein IW138_000214 [Coemansia sp. RSA 986]|nr:hypothetical protein IW138_000214 [Coemansia sp. RSA 986]
MTEDKTEDSGNRRFSLFSALNGLFERARSSAEKESHRLFTSPVASNARSRSNSNSSTSIAGPGDPSYGSPHKRPRTNTRPLLADSVTRTKTRPRPVRTAESRTAADTRSVSAKKQPRLSVALSLPPRPDSVISERTKLATTVDLMSIVTQSEHSVLGSDNEDDDDDRDVMSTGVEPSVFSTPGSHLKRKLSMVHSTASSSPMSAVPSTAATRSMRADSTQGAGSPKRARSAESAHTVASSALGLDEMLGHTSVLISGSGESTTTAHSVTPQGAEVHMPSKQQQQQPPPPLEAIKHTWRSNRKAVGFKGTTNGNDSDDEGHQPEVVERTRLEKVERELRQLKRIIASLVPGELNDDDLRSVYGELDGGRQSSEDVLSRLMRIRAGAVVSSSSHADGALLGSSYSSTMAKPLSSLLPAAASTTTPRGAVPPPPPLPQPPLSALARDSKAAASAAAAARAQLSLPPAPNFSGATPRKRTTPIGSPDAQPAEPLPRPNAATVQRLRADLRPVPASKPAPLPPPHKDPNVMSQMLQEMKTHKLRSVKKPKDMEAAVPKRQRHWSPLAYK